MVEVESGRSGRERSAVLGVVGLCSSKVYARGCDHDLGRMLGLWELQPGRHAGGI